jgi:hypothetical protein
LLPKIYKELYKTTKKYSKNGSKTWTETSPKEIYRQINVWIELPQGWRTGSSGTAVAQQTQDPDFKPQYHQEKKRSFLLYVSRKMWIKTLVKYLYIALGIAKIQNTDITKCWGRCGATGLIHCCWENKTVQPFWKIIWWFLTKLNSYHKIQ